MKASLILVLKWKLRTCSFQNWTYFFRSVSLNQRYQPPKTNGRFFLDTL